MKYTNVVLHRQGDEDSRRGSLDYCNRCGEPMYNGKCSSGGCGYDRTEDRPQKSNKELVGKWTVNYKIDGQLMVRIFNDLDTMQQFVSEIWDSSPDICIAFDKKEDKVYDLNDLLRGKK